MTTEVISTIRSSGGDYTTLAAWEAGEQAAYSNNLVTADVQVTAECYDDWPSGAAKVTIDGCTTDATRYMKITVAEGHRHTGIPDTGFFISHGGDYSAGVEVVDDYAVIEWVESFATSGGETAGFAWGANYLTFYNCIARRTEQSGQGYKPYNNDLTTKFFNCLAIGHVYGWKLRDSDQAVLYNCVATGALVGFYATSTATAKLFNCVGYNNSVWQYYGTFHSSSSNNATSTGSDDAPGGSSVYGITSADFVDASGLDFHVASGSELLAAGVNNSSVVMYYDAAGDPVYYTQDIDGDTWPSSGAWDIGFDYVASGGGGAPTGTGTLTTPAVTLAGTGTVAHKGTGALTTPATTLASAGKLGHIGTGELTGPATTLTGAGKLTHIGTGELTVPVVTLNGDGTIPTPGLQTGTGTLTTPAVTLSGAGKVTHTGTGDLSTAAVTLAGAGKLGHTGMGDLTTPAATLYGTDSTAQYGSGLLLLPAVTLSGSGIISSRWVKSASVNNSWAIRSPTTSSWS